MIMLRRHTRLDFDGSVHFVTTVTNVRGNWFVKDDTCTALLELFEGYRKQQQLDCFGFILMPDHLHALLRQTTASGTVPLFMGGFKSVSSRRLKPQGYPAKLLWRENYDDVPVPGSNALRTKMKYIHENPLRRGLVDHVEDYKWSSARQLYEIEQGIVTLTEISHS
jgi:putative transposase